MNLRRGWKSTQLADIIRIDEIGRGWRREDARASFAFNEDQMGVPRIRPAPQINPEEFERRLREGVQRTSPNDPLSKLARKTDSSRLPPPGPSRFVPNVTGHTRSYAESSELFDFGDVRESDETHDDETSIVDAQDPRALDVDDFRRWWHVIAG